jgi:hypothetical protein
MGFARYLSILNSLNMGFRVALLKRTPRDGVGGSKGGRCLINGDTMARAMKVSEESLEE